MGVGVGVGEGGIESEARPAFLHLPPLVIVINECVYDMYPRPRLQKSKIRIKAR